MMRICPKCEAEREFRCEERREEYTVRGLPVSFPVVVEVCETCGEDLYDESRDADLVEQAYAQYRREKGLLFPHEIAQIRNRYKLSQKS